MIRKHLQGVKGRKEERREGEKRERRGGEGGGLSRQTEERKEVRRSRAGFVSGDKSFSLGSPVNQRGLGGGGGGAVNQLEDEGEEVKKGDEGSEGDLLNDLFIFSAFVCPPPLLSLVLVTKISLPTWYVTVRSTVTV